MGERRQRRIVLKAPFFQLVSYARTERRCSLRAPPTSPLRYCPFVDIVDVRPLAALFELAIARSKLMCRCGLVVFADGV